MSEAADHAGTPRVIAGRYRLQSKIASGGMAAVWRAHDEVLARAVAVKILHDHLAADRSFRARLHREAVAAAKLTHPHIVSLYDTGSEGRLAWLVMELVDGPTLRAVMDERGPFEITEAAAIGEKIARALNYAHDHGLVHRDVKPANILLGHDGTVKVADFGIAKVEEAAEDLTGAGAVLGTAAYVAPEQILGEELDGACDQYALGCVLFEVLTGQRPFSGDSAVAVAAQRLEHDPPPLREVRPDVPAPLEAAVRRALARVPGQRHPSAGHLADALAPFAGPADTLVLPAAAPAPLPPVPSEPQGATVPDERRRTVALVGVLVAASAVLALVVAGISGDGARFGFLDGGSVRTAEGEIETVVPASLTLFDPGGTGSEDADDLPALVDGDDATAWGSVGYNTPDFGGLKPGLGFWLDLGGPHAVDSVALRTTTPGVSYEIRVADEPSATLDGWRAVATQADAGERSEVHLEGPVVARYVLVWITGDLQPDGSGRYRAGFSELTIRGQPA